MKTKYQKKEKPCTPQLVILIVHFLPFNTKKYITMISVRSIFTFIGIILLFHAGYSAHHFRRLLSSTDDSVELPPSDVVLECCISFALIMFGQIWPIKVLPVRFGKTTNLRRWDESIGAGDFKGFNHRGRLLAKRMK